MKKTAVVYWSGTGNTEVMAESLVTAINGNNNEATMFRISDFEPEQVKDFDYLAFGCPAMGAEELESSEFEPVFTECEKYLADKRVLLFGSYGWGDGEWMRIWEERTENAGAVLLSEGIISNDVSDNEKIISSANLFA